MNRQAKRRFMRTMPPQPKPQQSEVKFLIGDGKVIMQFPEAIKSASFTPEQAVGLAQILVKLVGVIENQKENATT